MRKILSLFMVLCLALSCSATVLADETKSTTVRVVGEGANSYEFNVPLNMTAGETKSTTLSGTWDSETTIKVTAPDSVTLVNDSNADEKVLDVDYAGFDIVGNDFTSIEETSDITVENVEVLFGTWEGIITYNLTVETNTTSVPFTLIKGYKLAEDGGLVESENYMVTDYITCEDYYAYVVMENQTFDVSAVGTYTKCLLFDDGKNILGVAYAENRTEQGLYTHYFANDSDASYFRIQFRITDEDISITKYPTLALELETSSVGYTQGITASDEYLYVSYSAQGGASVNDYKVRKIDRDTGEILLTSTETFNHANGMAYNENTNELIVCAMYTADGSEECDYSLFIADADTLEIKSTVNLKEIINTVYEDSIGLAGVAYSPTYNEYYILTRSPERHIITLNSDFTKKNSIYLGLKTDFPGTMGDICADDNYFYVANYRDDVDAPITNEIYIYDRMGTLVSTKYVFGKYHIESIAQIDNMFYISFVEECRVYSSQGL